MRLNQGCGRTRTQGELRCPLSSCALHKAALGRSTALLASTAHGHTGDLGRPDTRVGLPSLRALWKCLVEATPQSGVTMGTVTLLLPVCVTSGQKSKR